MESRLVEIQARITTKSLVDTLGWTHLESRLVEIQARITTKRAKKRWLKLLAAKNPNTLSRPISLYLAGVQKQPGGHTWSRDSSKNNNEASKEASGASDTGTRQRERHKHEDRSERPTHATRTRHAREQQGAPAHLSPRAPHGISWISWIVVRTLFVHRVYAFGLPRGRDK